MAEEIFGPVLPILPVRTIDEAITLVASRKKPLALYVFSRRRRNVEEILRRTTAGGTAVNTVVLHVVSPHLPFGGVGESGFGSNHGYFGFRAFSHERAVLRQGRFDTTGFLYPPYGPRVRRIVGLLGRLFG